MNAEPISVAKVLAKYLHCAKRKGDYVKGYINGEDAFNNFMKEFTLSFKTKFVTRSSCQKTKKCLPRNENVKICSRYGRSDRVYWEFKNRDLLIPFSGVPFIIFSSKVKDCQHGYQYYKLKETRTDTDKSSPNDFPDSANVVGSPSAKRARATQKRGCPACVRVREVLMYPRFSVHVADDDDRCSSATRKTKATAIARLRAAMSDDDDAQSDALRRFYVRVPLPEAHRHHPGDAADGAIDPRVRAKVDELIARRVYTPRHIRLIARDYLAAARLPPTTRLPDEREIADFVYLSSIAEQPPPPSRIRIETPPTACGGDDATRNQIASRARQLAALLSDDRRRRDGKTLARVRRQLTGVIASAKRGTAAGRKRAAEREIPAPAPPCATRAVAATSDVLSSFSRLMDAGHDEILPSLVERVVNSAPDFHHNLPSHFSQNHHHRVNTFQ